MVQREKLIRRGRRRWRNRWRRWRIKSQKATAQLAVFSAGSKRQNNALIIIVNCVLLKGECSLLTSIPLLSSLSQFHLPFSIVSLPFSSVFLPTSLLSHLLIFLVFTLFPSAFPLLSVHLPILSYFFSVPSSLLPPLFPLLSSHIPLIAFYRLFSRFHRSTSSSRFSVQYPRIDSFFS